MATVREARTEVGVILVEPAIAAEPAAAVTPRRTLAGYLLLGSALVTCPCHLPILAVFLAPLLVGTAFGSFLADNLGLVLLGFGAYFAGALVFGLRFLARAGDSCSTCEPAALRREG